MLFLLKCLLFVMYFIFEVIRSATVDSSLFSGYFGGCPVITAQGRTHPVTSYFLEDIYETINYHLPSDSPASISYDTPMRKKVSYLILDYGLALIRIQSLLNAHLHVEMT